MKKFEEKAIPLVFRNENKSITNHIQNIKSTQKPYASFKT